jgi:branched-chain amino acid transport system substrate-binding protein
MHRRLLKALVAVSAVALLATTAAGTAGSLRGSKAAAGSYNVGIVYSKTGLLSAYGAEYIEGLRLGLAYATHGTGKVNGKRINLQIADDGGDPAKAVSAAKSMIGKGTKIIAGTVSSGVALQLAPLADQNRILYISGPAASDAITGINKYTFRSGRQTWQDTLTADSFLNGVGKKIVVFAQDSAFGAGNVAAVRAVLGGKGHHVSSVLVPLTATDFTPFAQQAKNANPDLLFVAWAGTTAGAMWKALDQQGVFAGTKVVTGLAERATWNGFGGDVAGKIEFLSHYVYTAPKNKVNDFLVKAMRKRNQVPDLFTPDGFVAAQMIVHALQKGDYDVDKMVSALEGWRFLAPKGYQAIRPQDHAMLQPMFQVQLVKSSNSKVGWTPKVLGTVNSYKTAPPVGK